MGVAVAVLQALGVAPLRAPPRPVFRVCGDQALGQQGRMFGCSSSEANFGQIVQTIRIFSSTNMPYRWSDDEEYDWKADTASDAVRMEISLCFGRHKSRESCSAKVDAMLEKWALEKVEEAVFGL